MKRFRYIYLVLAICSFAGSLKAQENKAERFAQWGPTSEKGMGYVVRAGYVLGGTTPLPLPPEVRSINEFRPKGGYSLGIEGYKLFNARWGMTAGLRFFMQGMHTGADVKNYNMVITMGEDVVEGRYTGTDITDTRMAGFTVPVMATYRIGARWNFNLGPYFSYWIYSDFDGQVFDGYLREGSPVGQKIVISSDNPATYDFSDNMRKVSCGLEFCVDFRVFKHMNVFGLLDWGLSDVFKSDFETVTFKMYPLYATIGVAYYY